MRGKRSKNPRPFGSSGLFLLCAAAILLPSRPMTGEGAPDPLAAQAAAVVQDFFAGRFEELRQRSTPQMREAMEPAAAKQILEAILGQHGALQEIGAPWREDLLQGYTRYRVPVRFERRTVDMRVVFDAEGRVAGFFQVPHLPPPGPSEEKPDDPSVARPDLAGHWEGEIELPGTKLTVLLDLAQEQGGWRGTCDIPAQGANDLPLERIRTFGARIELSIAGIPGDPTFRGELREGKIRGTFTQSGQAFPFWLGRETIPPPPRPQEPKAPFPYRTEEVVFSHGAVRLAGTLTVPPGEPPFPAVVLLSGSGAQDRDGTVFGHRPFLVWADRLTRAGLAVLRFDDRGAGGSSGDLSACTLEDLARDALAAVRYLRTRPEIDPRRIGLLGHSEGGLVAPLAATLSGDVAFVVMLAGPGLPGHEILPAQMEALLRAAGVGAESLGRILEAQRALIEAVRAGAPVETIRLRLAALAEAQAGPEANRAEDGGDRGGALLVDLLTSPWFRSFLEHDPRPVLRRLEVPVLALFGERDLQVPAGPNASAVEEALRAAPTADKTVRIMPGLNHLFQEAQTGSPAEYAALEETVNPAALQAVSDWIVRRFGPGSGGR